ncbi:MAG: hypothetical protein U5R14_00805 [Gemmatimonadota bacterium]|nr:hypothetical protein [Gemmatimonadota bacterium]
MFKMLSLPTLLLAGALAVVSAPGTEVAASECGADGREKCWENESCIYLLFYSQCTTKTKYWAGL